MTKAKIEIAISQNESQNSIVAFVDQSKSILLQTVRPDVFIIETKNSVKT